MKLKQLFPSLLLLIFSSAAFAQNENPFASIGKKGKILTLTKGQYNETFDADTIQQIGSSLINVRTMKVVKLLTDDESKKRLEGEKHSRFLSVDPLSHSFANLTPYQYASNRPIDGIDLDGLEYIHFGVLLDKNNTVIKKVVLEDFRNYSEAELNKIHHTKNFYKSYSAGFGAQGKGVLYTYFKQGENGQFIPFKSDNNWEVRQNTAFKELTRHGLYYGEGCVTVKGPAFPTFAGQGTYDFSLKPIDMVDALGKRHDMEEDVRGFAGWRHPQNIFADIKFVKGLEKYLDMAKNPDFVDPFTGKKPSEEAIAAANNAVTLFNGEIFEKKASMLKMLANKEISQRLFAWWEKKVSEAEKKQATVPTPNPNDK
jgi:hypothetical protein